MSKENMNVEDSDMSDIDVRDFEDIPPVELRGRIISILKFVVMTLGFCMTTQEKRELNGLILTMQQPPETKLKYN